MADVIAFTRNYDDLSNESGFQFEFRCDRCGDGVRSTYHRSVSGAASGALSTASSILGGLFSSAGEMAERAREAAYAKEHDAALSAALNEIKPLFTKCPRCATYVCRSCWNDDAGLCLECAPRIENEQQATRAQVRVEKMEEAVRSGKAPPPAAAKPSAVCPQCGQPVGKQKFCGNCGAALTKPVCPSCGHENALAAKFCSECGAKLR